MPEKLPYHFWRIHARVVRAILADLPPISRAIVASDVDGTQPISLYVKEKAMRDAKTLFEDPLYYDNQPYTFCYSPSSL